jgi:hypothetical protein
MNFFSKKGFFSFLLLSAPLATLHGTSTDQRERADSVFGSAAEGGYGYGGGSGAASAYDAENTARQLAEDARIAAARAIEAKDAGNDEMAGLLADVARKTAEEIRTRKAAEEASRELVEVKEKLAQEEEDCLWVNPDLPAPTLTTRNSGIWKPREKGIILFPLDVLYVIPPAKMPAGAQLQYKISDYEGPRKESPSLSLFWQDTQSDDLWAHQGFKLPPGYMTVHVRMITRHNNEASPASQAYKFEVKGG